MPTRDAAWPAGTPCWIDYGAADLAAAKSLYAELLGWTYSGNEDPQYGGYLMAEAKGRPAAGLAPQQDADDPPRWTTYFATDDADATAAKITAAGGRLAFPPMDVGPMGRMSIAFDPEGNVFGIWQSGQHTGARIYNEPGALVWNEVAVEDLAAAQAFYGAVFGFTFEEFPDMGGYATFTTGNGPLGGIGPLQPGAHRGWTTCFSVTSADDAVAVVEKAGGKVLMAPQDTSFGRFAVLRDPWDAAFSVMQELDG